MDKNVLDAERVNNCCYAISGKDGVFSFCAYNNLHRFADAEKKTG